MIEVLELEQRVLPVLHPFNPAAMIAASDNAAGTPANATVIRALGGIPAPLQKGNPPFTEVPGVHIVEEVWTELGRL